MITSHRRLYDIILAANANWETTEKIIQIETLPPVWEMAVYLAVAGDVFDGVFFVLSLFPRDVLDEIWDLIESVSEGFPTYFYDEHAFKIHLILTIKRNIRSLGHLTMLDCPICQF